MLRPLADAVGTTASTCSRVHTAPRPHGTVSTCTGRMLVDALVPSASDRRGHPLSDAVGTTASTSPQRPRERSSSKSAGVLTR